MRVNVDGGKYTICSDDATGRLWVERGDCVDWMVNPAGSKMLLSAAYELACLRQIARDALALLDEVASIEDKTGMVNCIHGRFTERQCEECERDAHTLHAFADLLRKKVADLSGYTDFKRSLNDPLDL